MVDDLNKIEFEEGTKYLMPTYGRLPVVFEKAKMQYLWDLNGKKYIDFIAGYGCLNVGHSNALVLSRIKKQISKIIQPSNVYFNIPQTRLAKKLCDITGFGRKVFFSNSGTEAIEGAVKLARKYSKEKFGPDKIKIISFLKSFHGRTMGALSATAQTEKQKIFEPLLKGFDYTSLNDIEVLKEKMTEDVAAILVEPVQGEGGVNVCDRSFLKELRALCDKKDILLILDEVQTGFGRTGKMFAFEHYGIRPDILVLAKSLGGGMPIGAIISDDDISSVFSPGSHGSTFGGNAASCAAGLAVIEFIEQKGLIEKAEILGDWFAQNLDMLKERYSIIREVRGLGLMRAMELKEPIAEEIVEKALKDGLVLNRVSDHTLRFLPPLIIEKKNLKVLINWLNRSLKGYDHGK